MRVEREADVCIVGLGGVGAMAAAALAAAGRRVLALEAGPARTGREYVMDEIESSMVRNTWGAAKFNHEIPTWRPNALSATRPTPYTQRMANGVGGSSLAYAMISFRYHPDDFRVRSATLARYGAEALPAGTDLTDWPVTYEDLEPYYDLAEVLLGVSGRAGNLRGERLAGGNPFEGPRRHEYPLPPLRTSGLGMLFRDAATRAGYHPFPMPAAILSQPYRGRAACTYCSFCSRQGCHVGAKGSTFATVLPPALASGRLEIRTECRAMRVTTDERGIATGVEYLTHDGMHFQPAHVVVLAAYTFENVRLLLLSRGPCCPAGLGNNAGQVGRYYMARQLRAVSGMFGRHRLNRFIGSSAQGHTIDDFNADHFDHTGLGFIRGGRITMPNNFVPIVNSATIPPDVPRWGSAHKAFLVHAYHHIATATVDAETLPYDANTLDVDPRARDSRGIPVIRVTFDAVRERAPRAGIPSTARRRIARAHGRRSDVARAGRRARVQHSRCRRYAHGDRPGPIRSGRIWPAVRHAQCVGVRRIDLPDARRAEPYAHDAGAGAADSRPHRADRRGRRAAGPHLGVVMSAPPHRPWTWARVGTRCVRGPCRVVPVDTLPGATYDASYIRLYVTGPGCCAAAARRRGGVRPRCRQRHWMVFR